ncbi:hypothetical protein HHL23_07785 [Chryseobacterium sp. RP-3-3]|uniref:Glycosyltransferase RgtA/B/C/D-like domain-containing protein n=1 Tax=Chryseobacterium antibioticum TaxID=2728847 RepID=A0A7Y0ALX7_9FLAO|nr:hypothetical protein [Chryseobacterium antibioticum]NML69694.1 hypothetical protein [Chryseobacterium antibioticum]
MKKTGNILVFIFSIYLCLMSYYLYTHQYYNVDLEAYIGLIYKAEYPDMKIEDIHKKVYTELKGTNPKLFGITPQDEEIAKGENTYYKVLSENPKAYGEELQLFSVKPFYNFVNLMFFKLGFKMTTSVFLTSILSYVLILIVIFCYLIRIVRNYPLAFIITILISLFKPLLEASRHASADSLSCLLLLLSLYAFTVRKNHLAATVIAMLCVLTRPEYFILYSFLYMVAYLYKNMLQIKATHLFLSYGYVFLSFFLIQYFNQISWSTLFMNQFTKVQIYPISNPDSFYFPDYLNFIKKSMPLEFNGSYFPLLLIFIVVIMANKFSLNSKKNWAQCLFFGAIYLSVFLRFLVFPSLANRMMIGFYLIIILSLIYIQNSKANIFKNSLEAGK